MTNLSTESTYSIHSNSLTLLELTEVALYTIQKINNYPENYSKTVENYFHLLFPDEIKAYFMRRAINEKYFDKPASIKPTPINNENSEWRALLMSAQVKQVKDLRNLCKLIMEQQESVLTLISDKLDEMEADLSAVSENKDKGGGFDAG